MNPEEIQQAIRFLEGENQRLLDRLAPLKEGKCPRCLTPLAPGAPANGRGECPACGWGKPQLAPDPPEGRCGLCCKPDDDGGSPVAAETMPLPNSSKNPTRQAGLARVEAAWQRLSDELEAEKRRIADEIRAYPTPIPACDAQFNHLLAQRARLSQELIRLRHAREASRSSSDPVAAFRDFIQSSGWVGDEEK
jgi:hypothetical protein